VPIGNVVTKTFTDRLEIKCPAIIQKALCVGLVSTHRKFRMTNSFAKFCGSVYKSSSLVDDRDDYYADQERDDY
jgi:hypothetical protein